MQQNYDLTGILQHRQNLFANFDRIRNNPSYKEYCDRLYRELMEIDAMLMNNGVRIDGNTGQIISVPQTNNSYSSYGSYANYNNQNNGYSGGISYATPAGSYSNYNSYPEKTSVSTVQSTSRYDKNAYNRPNNVVGNYRGYNMGNSEPTTLTVIPEKPKSKVLFSPYSGLPYLVEKGIENVVNILDPSKILYNGKEDIYYYDIKNPREPNEETDKLPSTLKSDELYNKETLDNIVNTTKVNWVGYMEIGLVNYSKEDKEADEELVKDFTEKLKVEKSDFYDDYLNELYDFIKKHGKHPLLKQLDSLYTFILNKAIQCKMDKLDDYKLDRVDSFVDDFEELHNNIYKKFEKDNRTILNALAFTFTSILRDSEFEDIDNGLKLNLKVPTIFLTTKDAEYLDTLIENTVKNAPRPDGFTDPFKAVLLYRTSCYKFWELATQAKRMIDERFSRITWFDAILLVYKKADGGFYGRYLSQLTLYHNIRTGDYKDKVYLISLDEFRLQ